MFTRISVFEIIFVSLALPVQVFGLHLYNITTCEAFERGARLDPYEIIDSRWKIFYFWSENTEKNAITFSLVSKERLDKFRAVIEAVEPHFNVQWHKATLFMEPRPGVEVLLLYASTSGAFRAIIKMNQRKKLRPQPGPLIKLADLRMKTEDRYMGMMCCEDMTAFALARLDELPPTEEDCVAGAATLGLRGPGGRSYLYLRNITRTEL